MRNDYNELDSKQRAFTLVLFSCSGVEVLPPQAVISKAVNKMIAKILIE